MKTGTWALAAALLFAARFCGADTAPDCLAKLAPVAPFDTARAAAAADGIPLDRIDPPGSGGDLSPGDSITALMTLHEKNRGPAQWLIYFQAAGARQTAPEDTAPMVMYTSTGNKFEFPRSQVGIRVRIVGPFLPPDAGRRTAAQDRSANVSMNKGFLGIGFDRGAAAAFRWDNFDPKKDAEDFLRSFSCSCTPFDGPQVDIDRKLAARLNVTPDEERSVAGWVPAISSYFSAVEQTPNLRGILMKVLDKPSLWSVMRHLGVTTSIDMGYDCCAPVSTIDTGLPAGAPAYSLPAIVSINDQQALNLTMLVASPHPPLLICGGIIGLLAENPVDAENYLTLRVISAHCGAAVTAAK